MVDEDCISSKISDLAVLYYPFLIAASLSTVIVIFGQLKKKAILVNGNSKLIS